LHCKLLLESKSVNYQDNVARHGMNSAELKVRSNEVRPKGNGKQGSKNIVSVEVSHKTGLLH